MLIIKKNLIFFIQGKSIQAQLVHNNSIVFRIHFACTQIVHGDFVRFSDHARASGAVQEVHFDQTVHGARTGTSRYLMNLKKFSNICAIYAINNFKLKKKAGRRM